MALAHTGHLPVPTRGERIALGAASWIERSIARRMTDRDERRVVDLERDELRRAVRAARADAVNAANVLGVR